MITKDQQRKTYKRDSKTTEYFSEKLKRKIKIKIIKTGIQKEIPTIQKRNTTYKYQPRIRKY
jgi:hypothetical protein